MQSVLSILQSNHEFRQIGKYLNLYWLQKKKQKTMILTLSLLGSKSLSIHKW